MKKALILMLILLISCAKETQPTQLAPITNIQIIQSEYPNKPMYEPPPTPPQTTQYKIEITPTGFQPNQITLPKEQIIDILIISSQEHNFTIPGYQIKQKLNIGDTIIPIITNKEGQYNFYADKIMGEIIVR